MDVFFFDTSALLNDTTLLNKCYGILLIHNIVIDELDSKADKKGVAGKNARCVIDKLFQISKLGDIHKGVNIGNDTFVKIIDTKPNEEYIDFGLSTTKNDNLILAVFKELCEKHPNDDMYFMCGDKMLSVKTDVGIVKYIGKGVPSYNKKKQSYRNQKNTRNFKN